MASTSLMPFYSILDREGYLACAAAHSPATLNARIGSWPGQAFWVQFPTSKDRRTVIHHENFNEADNNPSNLWFMGDRDHSRLHRLLVERNESWQSPEFEAARSQSLGCEGC